MNCYAEAILFKSGVALFTGLTFQMDEKRYRGRRFLDTPGLNDTLKREQAAKSITKAMRQEGLYRLFFLMLLHNGRLLPEDVTTMSKVLESAQGQLSDNSFGVIFNQVEDAEYEKLMEDEENMRRLLQMQLFTNPQLPKTEHIFFNRKTQDLAGKKDTWVKLDSKTRRFINSIQGIKVTKENVLDIAVADWDQVLEKERQATAAAEEAAKKVQELEEKAKEEKRKHDEEREASKESMKELDRLRQQGIHEKGEEMANLRRKYNDDWKQWEASKEAEQRAQQEKEEEAKRHLEAEKKRLEDDFAQEIERVRDSAQRDYKAAQKKIAEEAEQRRIKADAEADWKKEFEDLFRGEDSVTMLSKVITGDAVKVFADVLKDNTTVQELNIFNAKLGDAGVEALAEALKVNRTLNHLDMDSNEIDDASAEALAEALKANNMLKRLRLPYNKIGVAGAEALAEALKAHKTLQKLSLFENKIGDAGAEALAEAWKARQAALSIASLR